MTSVKRYVTRNPSDVRWFARLARICTVAGLTIVNQHRQEVFGWQVTTHAYADKSSHTDFLQVVTLYHFVSAGEEIVTAVIAVDDAVESRIARYLHQAGFCLMGLTGAMHTVEQLDRAGFNGRNRFGHDLVHPELLSCLR